MLPLVSGLLLQVLLDGFARKAVLFLRLSKRGVQGKVGAGVGFSGIIWFDPEEEVASSYVDKIAGKIIL